MNNRVLIQSAKVSPHMVYYNKLNIHNKFMCKSILAPKMFLVTSDSV